MFIKRGKFRKNEYLIMASILPEFDFISYYYTTMNNDAETGDKSKK